MNPAPTPSSSGRTSEEGRRPSPISADQAVVVHKLIHELNNALSVISINSTLLRSGAVEDERDQMLDEIRDSSQAAAMLLVQLRRWTDGAGGPGGPDGI